MVKTFISWMICFNVLYIISLSINKHLFGYPSFIFNVIFVTFTVFIMWKMVSRSIPANIFIPKAGIYLLIVFFALQIIDKIIGQCILPSIFPSAFNFVTDMPNITTEYLIKWIYSNIKMSIFFISLIYLHLKYVVTNNPFEHRE